jgi:hypothetical protein
MADLVIQEAHHVHAADEVGVQGGVHTIATLNGADHVVADTFEIVSPSWHGTTLQEDGKTYPKLPAVVSFAYTGYRINASEELPGIQLTDARVGIRSGPRPYLPLLASSAVMSKATRLSLNRVLPAMSLSANSGIRSGTLKLPTPTLTITSAGADKSGSLDKHLPGLTLSASASTPVLATLASDLPAITISAELAFVTTATLAKDLPAFKVSASALSGATITLSENLPAIVFDTDDDATLYGDALSLDAYLPTLLAAVGSSGESGVAATATSESRWTDYVLRHVR